MNYDKILKKPNSLLFNILDYGICNDYVWTTHPVIYNFIGNGLC